MAVLQNIRSGGTLTGMGESPDKTSGLPASATAPTESPDAAAVNGKARKVTDAEFEVLLAKVLVDDAELLERLSR